jgi:hypothetical protein
MEKSEAFFNYVNSYFDGEQTQTTSLILTKKGKTFIGIP